MISPVATRAGICRFYILLCALFFGTAAAHAQQDDKDERKEQQAEKKEQSKEKVDLNLFHRQMLTLPEYSNERRRLASQNGDKGKVTAYVDTATDAENSKFLTGYIARSSGGEVVNLYEVSFDRSIRKIVGIKPTGEATGNANMDEDHDEPTLPAARKTTRQKAGDDDEEEEEKPARKKPADDE